MFPHQIKCVIWDLDETLWTGSLAEHDVVVFKEHIIDLIGQLDEKGIINSICSKNNYEESKKKLQEAGIWEYFVFSVIDFVPKGRNVKTIVENLQLRTENALFVDDNVGNRNEVKHYCKNIMVADANDENFLEEMVCVIERTKGGSRLERYKVLEKKHKAKQLYADNASFLEDSSITVCILRNPTDLKFKKRIFDLANRTNQLNFTTSRFKTYEEFEDYLESERSMNIHHGVIFVYDKYGDYGLVGFYAFDEQRGRRALEHFFFSCRILNMGVEQTVYNYLRSNFDLKPFPAMEKKSGMDIAFIRIIHDIDDRVRDYVDSKMNVPKRYKTIISAGCTSGIIGHYLPEEMKPVSFDLFSIAHFDKALDETENIIYAIYGDYINVPWKNAAGFSYNKFREHLVNFLQIHQDKKIYLLLASEDYRSLFPRQSRGFYKKIRLLAAAVLYGANNTRFKKCNAIVRQISVNYPNVTIIETGAFVHSKTEQYDPRHFERIVIKRICEYIASLIE